VTSKKKILLHITLIYILLLFTYYSYSYSSLYIKILIKINPNIVKIAFKVVLGNKRAVQRTWRK
jgi:hypothetical protein